MVFALVAKPSQAANALNPALNYDLYRSQTYGKYIYYILYIYSVLVSIRLLFFGTVFNLTNFPFC